MPTAESTTRGRTGAAGYGAVGGHTVNSMGFFDLPPPEEDENDGLDELDDYSEGRWLAGVVPVEEFIGRSDQAAVAARKIVALPDGFEVEIAAWLRQPPRRQARFGPFHREIILAAHGPYQMRNESGAIIDEFVRFGVQFPDGGRATNLDRGPGWPDATEPMHGMETRGGSSSRGEAEQQFWIWPVPLAGDITLVCEWPAYGIEESRLTIDGDELRAAAARARPVWPGEPAAPQASGGRGHASSFRRSRMAARRAAVTAALADSPSAEAEAEDGAPDPAGEA